MSNKKSPLYNLAVDHGNHLLISVSGIRGVIPDGLNSLNIVLFTRAFCAITGKKIVIGNDARPTGPMMKHLITGVLMSAGKEIIDIGLAPTPTVKAAVKTYRADAGIMISASHNPTQWNAFKFIDKNGFFFNKDRIEELKAALDRNDSPDVEYKKLGRSREANGIQDHILSVLDIIPNVPAIKRKKYTVVVDAVAGAGRVALPQLLKALGCKVEELYCEADANDSFPRPPEPTPDSLKQFSKKLKETKAAIGFALDPDADRLVIGSKNGAINEEYTLPLSLFGLLSQDALKEFQKNGHEEGFCVSEKVKGKIVLNLSTSDLVDYVASRIGSVVHRSAVGEANVVESMKIHRAMFGGEGNGGVIHPSVPSYGRDPIVGAALILSAMTMLNADSVEDLMKMLPELFMKKIKVERGSSNLSSIFKKMTSLFPDAAKNEDDGLHLTLSDHSWIHARASNTEPVIRLIAQAPSKKRLNQILSDAEETIKDE